MKKLLIVVMAVVLVLSLCSCKGKEAAKEYDVNAVADAISGSGAFIGDIQPVRDEIIATDLGVNADGVAEMKVYMCADATAEEYGVFKCNSEEDASSVAAKLQTRIDNQKITYQSYAPDAIPRLDNAVLRTEGVYVFYIVADNGEAASSALDTALAA